MSVYVLIFCARLLKHVYAAAQLERHTKAASSESSSTSRKSSRKPLRNVSEPLVLTMGFDASTRSCLFCSSICSRCADHTPRVRSGRLITKIFHPNVSSQGEICVNTLKKDWQSSFGIGHILVTVKCLLIHPNPESALDEEAGKLLLEDYESYCERAKLITNVHATPKVQ